MTVITNCASLDADFCPLLPGDHVDFAAPFELTNNKNMTRVYPKLTNGSEFAVQFGADVDNPVNIGIFNGKDWNTGEMVSNKRSLSVEVAGDTLDFVTRLEAHILQYAKDHKSVWFPDQPNIKDTDIAKIMQPLVQTNEYGSRIKMDATLGAGRKPFKYYSLCEAGIKEDVMPTAEDDTRPLRMQGLLTVDFYVYITKKANGKRYDKIGIKFNPSNLCCVGLGGGGGRGVSLDDSLVPLDALLRMAPSIGVGELRGVDKHQYANMLFGDLQLDGQTGSFTFAEAGGTVPTTRACVAWPPYGESKGDAVALEFDVEPDTPLHAALGTVDSAVKEWFETNAATLPEPHNTWTPEDINDAFVGVLRENGGKYSIRASVSPSTPAFCVTDAAPEAADTLTVMDGAVPLRTTAVPYGAVQFRINVKTTPTGALDSIAVKMQVRGYLYDKIAVDQPVFQGLPVQGSKRSHEEPLDDREAKVPRQDFE